MLNEKMHITYLVPGVVAHVCNSSYLGSGGRRSSGPDHAKLMSFYLKHKIKTREGGMAQVVKHLSKTYMRP
jgi:hypothetical protein